MYHCNYCQDDITGIRMRCAECADFDLCLQCFSCGAEIGTHKRDHNYQFIDCGNLPIFKQPNAWKSREELMLLEAIEQYGFGNWEDVSECVDDKDTDDVKDHYNNMYIVGNVGRATWSVENHYTIKDHTCPEGGPLSPSLATPTPLELASPEQQELGYMPFRDDFEREFENEAETLACNLVITNEDEDIDIALKLAHIDMYSQKLRERLRRKRIAKDFQLVGQFFSSTNQKQKAPTPKKKQTREEKELQEKMVVFCQFHTATDHEQFFENIQKEKDLKSRIKELIRYRRNGLTRVDECLSFETARYRREKRKENKKKSGSSTTSAHRRSNVTASKKQEEKGGDTTTEEHEDDKKEDGKDVEISCLPGYQLLSEKEKKLCQSIRLKPSYYLSFKTILLKDHLQKQQGQPVKARYPAGLDKAHRRRIVHLLVSGGFLSPS